MATPAPPFETQHAVGPIHGRHAAALRYAVPVGRVLFALIFILSAQHLFAAAGVDAARQHGVPLPSVAVPAAGVLALAGGLSVALGYRARVGAWLLLVFLVPVTLFMHAFWAESDPGAVQMQMVSFMKNLALIGGSLMIAYFGSGPVSIDAAR